jgi:hypothetical protein
MFGGKLIELKFEKGRNYDFEVTHEINDFYILYPKISFRDFALEDTDIKSLLERINGIMRDLNIEASRFLLEIKPEEAGTAACSVDKRKTIHLVLPVHLRNGHIIVPSRGIGENYILYHELMHAKDILEGRFPSVGIIDIEEDFKEYLCGLAEDFSIEGRLERMGLPHYTREQSIANANDCIAEVYEMGFRKEEIQELFQKDFSERLCDDVWGRELTSTEAYTIVEKLLG